MEKRIVDITTTVAADRTTVWSILTGPDGVVMPGTKVKTDWQVGSPVVFHGEWQGKAFEDHGEILSMTDKSNLSMSHWGGNGPRPATYHVIRYDLSPAGEQTRVTLTQTNVGEKVDADEKTRAEFTKMFQAMLDGLKAKAEAHAQKVA